MMKMMLKTISLIAAFRLKKQHVYLFIGLLGGVLGFRPLKAQTNLLDSLKNELKINPKKTDEITTSLFGIAAQNLSADVKLAQAYIDEILAVQKEVKDKNIVSAAYRVKGVIHFHLAMYPEALVYLHKALEIDEKLKNDFGIGGDLGTIGLVYMTQSKFSEALKYYLRSLQRFENVNDVLDAALTRVNIGIIYNEMGDYDQAMKNFQGSLTYFKEQQHILGQINTLTNIGIVYLKKKNIPEAIKYSELALRMADSIQDIRSSGRENGNLSGYYNRVGQHKRALEYGLKAVAINEQISNKKSLGFNQQNVSAAYLKLGNITEAKKYGLNALQIGNELGVMEIQKEASLGMSEVYEAQAKPDSALFYYKMFTTFSDSMSNDNTKSEVTKMGMRYEFDKTENLYKQKQLLADEQLKQQQLELALSLAQIQQVEQLKNLQAVQLQNEKLLNEEKQKQLIISQTNEKLQANKVDSLSQQQKLDKLELKQLWLYWVLALITLISVLIYLLNLYRLRRLKFKNTLQQQEAAQTALRLKHQYQLSESELKAIRSQMNPHFIFNVLNSIESYIMDNDKKTASRLVQKFASLSRLILENSTKSLVSADKEWKALMLYTELEAIRYNNSFSYQFIVDEELPLKTLFLPPMLIQPLIENAILHGLMTDNQPDAHLEVKLQKNGDGLRVTIKDNGLGIENKHLVTRKPVGIKEKSIGMESIKERIDMINVQNQADTASFAITGGDNHKGTIATICLPMFYKG
jgi:tetratricopeptide (TPR) repeat protein/anti-sigma regulatory factor (Ser/Thr protein kinase)